jgi:glutaredoxin
MQNLNIPPFTLYGLIGCPHCVRAEQYLKIRNVPYIAMYINGDPIITEGIKQVTNANQEAPVLVSRLTNEVISGFKEPDYERVAKLFYSLAGISAPSIFGGAEQPVPQASVQTQTAAVS